MAQSLVCRDCDTLLRSVKEAQAHADATGHTNFEESTAAILRLVCTECGKVCRSYIEKDQHTRFTGHAMFEEKTGEGSLNTEAQMAEARAELKEDDKPEGLGGEKPAEEALVAADVSEALLQLMLDMGFERNRSVRAIYNSGGEAVDAAVGWLAEHEGDADLDEPLLVPAATAKRKLSPDEAKEQAAELLRKVKERRLAEERETERLREQERIRMGKEMAAMARLEEEARLRRIVEERQREKEEEARAREKVKKKLEEDRRARRRAAGLPEELTEEEKEAERKKEQEKAEAEAKRRLPVKPVAKAERMRELLVAMKKAHPDQDEALKTAWQTLLKLIGNVATNPGEERFRKVRLTNPAIQKRVAAFKGAVEFLEVCGFHKDTAGETLEIPEGGVDRLVLEAAGENLNSALVNPFFGML